MNIRLHFFKDRKSNINIKHVYEFFDEDNFAYSQHEKYIAFKYVNKMLENRASFVFVKHNVIPDIYTLSSSYTNLNLFVEFPLIISDYYLNEILNIVHKFTKKFNLYYFHELNEDIEAFGKKEVFNKLLDYRDRTISVEEITKVRRKVLVESKKLYEVCSYQDNVNVLNEYFDGNLTVNPYIIMRNYVTEEFALSVRWDINQPAIFPKHIDFIHIYYEDSELPVVVPQKEVIGKIHRFLALLPNFVEGTRILKPGTPTKKASRLQNKFKNNRIDEEEYEIIPLIHVLDERNYYE